MDTKGPVIEYIEGKDEVEKYFFAINETLQQGDEVLTFGARAGNPQSSDTVDFFMRALQDRSKRSIKTRIIFNDDARSVGSFFEVIPLTDVKYMPMGIIAKTGLDIYGDHIGIMDWSDVLNPRVILIKDKVIAESYRDYFQVLWSATTAISELEKKGNFYLPEILFEDFVAHSDEKQNVEKEILTLLNNLQPKKMLNIGSGFDSISKSESFPKSVEKLTFVEKNTSYIQSYTDQKIEVIQADYGTWNSSYLYDVILASHVLFYFPDKEQILKKIVSELEKGGVALFVVHNPKKDYKAVKDLIFKKHNKEYVFTYDTLIDATRALGVEYECIDVDCQLKAKSSDELYKSMRLWFEMDLETYYRCEEEVKHMFPDNTVNYTNTIVIVKSPTQNL